MPSKILELRRKVSGSFNNGDSLSYVRTNWAAIDGKPPVYPPAGHTHNLDQINEGATYKRVTQSEKDGWNSKQNALGYTPENAANKRTSIRTSGATNTAYVTELGVKTYVDGLIPEIMSVQEGIDGSYTDARAINAYNLRGIIEDYIATADKVGYRGLLGTTDLNTLNNQAAQGIYSQNANVNATLERNYPTASSGAGLLRVYWTGANSGVIQEYNNYIDGRIYIRAYQGSTWSGWRTVATQDWVTSNTRSNTWTPTWAQVSGKPSWIDSNKPTYSYSEIGGLQAQLDDKAPLVHVQGWDTISSKPTWITANKPVYNLGEVEETTTYKRVTQSEKNTWNGKENAIAKGTTAQYFRGDMSLATFPTIPTIPSLMTQADITSSTTTQRTINASTLNANFYDKTSIDLLMSGKQNSLGFTPVPNTRTIAGLDLTANRTRDQILGVSANGYVRRTGANTYDIRTVANLKSDLGLGTLASSNGLALNDLTNVTFGGTPTAGQILTYGAGVWTNVTPTYAYTGMPISRTITADNTYDLLSTDLNKLIIVNAYSGCAFIITTAFNNAAAIGAEVQFFNKSGAAAELYSTASGVSVLSEGNKIGFSGWKTMMAIKKISSTEWIMVGALT